MKDKKAMSSKKMPAKPMKHMDEKQDKKMVKKMVKKGCMK